MIKVIVASPEKEIYNGEAKKVFIKTADGEIGILSGHEPLMSVIESGEVVVEKEAGERVVYSAYNGVVNIENEKGKTRVVILVESTEDVKSLDKELLEKSLADAQKANKEKADDSLNLESGILKDMNRLRLARKYKV